MINFISFLKITEKLFSKGRWFRLSLLICCLGFLSEPANAQATRINISFSDASFKEVIQFIREQSDYDFVYSDADIAIVKRQKIDLKNVTVQQVLDHCLANSGLVYNMVNKTIVIKKAEAAKQTSPVVNKLEIAGSVKDKQGNPLPGVTIVIKGSKYGFTTDLDGLFRFELSEVRDITLVFSFIGMETQEIVFNGQKFLEVVMTEEATQMDEVVVTGMFERRKEGYTGSATVVKGDDLKKFSKTSIAKALSAIDPGFRIADNIETGSDPNRLPDLRMRGQATLPTGATVATDAVMLKGDYATYPNQPLLILDGFEISLQTMNDLDPDRVASITILKDAAATAIYGSKAANGVIVIETKAPAPGTLQVTYAGEIRMEIPDLSDYNLMNAAEKLEVERLAGYYDETGELAPLEIYQYYLREVKRGVDTYWLSKPLRTGVSHRHAITLEGGDQALRYKLYVGMNNTAGVMIGSNRHTQTASLDLTYRFKRFLLKNSVTVDNAVGNNSPYGSFRDFSQLNPYWRDRDEKGEILKKITPPVTSYSGVFQSVYNPLYNATFHSLDKTSDFGIRNLFQLEYRPLEALRLLANVSVSKQNGKVEVFRPAQHTAFDGIADPQQRGDFNLIQSESFTWQTDFTASYNNVFQGVHFLSLNLRMTMNDSQNSNYGALVTGFPNDQMDYILFGKKYNEKMTGSENTNRSVGWVGSFNYSYDYRYSLDFNIRADGASQFGSNNRFAPFWSVGAKWNLKKENFMSQLDFWSDLTLRVSYGTTGTQGFAPYQAQQLYTYGNTLKPYLASDATGAELVGLGNPDLKWQQTDQTNIALEMGWLDGRITARAEYFRKITKNALTDISLAPSIGFSTVSENLGSIRNQGVELMLSFIPYRNTEKAAQWVINLNGSHNTDKLVKISQALRHMNEQNAGKLKDVPLPRYEEGESLNRIWVVKSLGIDPATGQEIFVKRSSGEFTGIWSAEDQIPYGNTEPFMEGNINSLFSYKGWGVNFSFHYKFGGQTYNTTLIQKVENADLRYNADRRVMEDRWKKPGDVVKYKALTNSAGGSETKASSRFVMDENVLQFSSLTLTYRMDKTNTEFMKKSIFSSITMNLGMEDVFRLSSVKQERGLDYPFARQFSFSLNVGF